jgi:EAL domain-containing protein (putative c-di-GMP-specific phosphodiesterase class I)
MRAEPIDASRLQAALEQNQFRLFYQPQIDQITGRIVGAEALLRWLDPERGLIAPARFLASVEAAGLIAAVGEWALKQAAEDCLRWRQRGLPRLRLGLNVSPAQIQQRARDPRVLDTAALRACCDLYLEIDGRQICDASESMIKALHALQVEGVNIAVQGFGADESLCGRLWSLPVDVLKVDRSFVQRIVFDIEAARTVASLVALARAFRLGLIAECVETSQQLARLVELGCRQVQGLVYSDALPASRFEELLGATLATPGWAALRQTGASADLPVNRERLTPISAASGRALCRRADAARRGCVRDPAGAGSHRPRGAHRCCRGAPRECAAAVTRWRPSIVWPQRHPQPLPS